MDEDSVEADESKPNRLAYDWQAPPRFQPTLLQLGIMAFLGVLTFRVFLFEWSPFFFYAATGALIIGVLICVWRVQSRGGQPFQFSLQELGLVVTLLAVFFVLYRFLGVDGAFFSMLMGACAFHSVETLREKPYRSNKRGWIFSGIGLAVSLYLMLGSLTCPIFQQNYWERYCQATVTKSAILVPGSDLQVRLTPNVNWDPGGVPFLGDIIAGLTTGPRFEVEILGRAPSEEAVSLLQADIQQRWRRDRGFQIEWGVKVAQPENATL